MKVVRKILMYQRFTNHYSQNFLLFDKLIKEQGQMMFKINTAEIAVIHYLFNNTSKKPLSRITFYKGDV